MKISEDEHRAQPGDSQQTHAADLPVVNEAGASPQVKRVYQQFRQDIGRSQLPGILQCLVTRPPLLAYMIGLAESMLFVDGALPREHKEIISAIVSATKRCDYCADSYAYDFWVHGGSEPALNAVLACDPDTQSMDAEECALPRLRKGKHRIFLCHHARGARRMRVAGWSDLQIAAAIHVTALFATFNRIVNAFGLPSKDLLRLFGQLLQDEVEAPSNA